MESNHHSLGHRVYSAASSPVLSVRGMREDRPESNRRREDHGLECIRYTTALTEAGTIGIEPTACRLTSGRSPTSYAPSDRAGASRTRFSSS
jgi:hypothetical protein